MTRSSPVPFDRAFLLMPQFPVAILSRPRDAFLLVSAIVELAAQMFAASSVAVRRTEGWMAQRREIPPGDPGMRARSFPRGIVHVDTIGSEGPPSGCLRMSAPRIRGPNETFEANPLWATSGSEASRSGLSVPPQSHRFVGWHFLLETDASPGWFRYGCNDAGGTAIHPVAPTRCRDQAAVGGSCSALFHQRGLQAERQSRGRGQSEELIRRQSAKAEGGWSSRDWGSPVARFFKMPVPNRGARYAVNRNDGFQLRRTLRNSG